MQELLINKKIYIVITFTLLLLLFIPTVVPNFVNTGNTPIGIGISDIEPGRTTFSDTLDEKSYSFYFIQLKVTIYDNSGLWKRITGFTIEIFTIENNPNTLISTTEWNSLRDFKGSVVVGGSIVINSEDQPADNTPMFVRIKLESVEYFIEKTYQKTMK